MHVLNNCYFIFFFLPGGARDNDHNDLDFLNDEEKKRERSRDKKSWENLNRTNVSLLFSNSF